MTRRRLEVDACTFADARWRFDGFVTTGVAQQWLGVSRKVIRAMARDGMIEGAMIVHGRKKTRVLVPHVWILQALGKLPP